MEDFIDGVVSANHLNDLDHPLRESNKLSALVVLSMVTTCTQSPWSMHISVWEQAR